MTDRSNPYAHLGIYTESIRLYPNIGDLDGQLSTYIALGRYGQMTSVLLQTPRFNNLFYDDCQLRDAHSEPMQRLV